MRNHSGTTPLLELGKSEVHLPFEIHTMAWIEENRWQQNAIPHRHNYFVIIWVKTGKGIHLIDLDRLELQPDTVYCITPGQVHQLIPAGPVDGYVISFTADFAGPGEDGFDLLFNAGLFNTFSRSPVIHVNAEMSEEMEDMAAKLMKEYRNHFLLRSEILKGYLKIFLIYLTRQFDRDKADENNSANVVLVKKFLSLVDKRFTSRRMVADYADELVVTPNYLNEVVKKVTGFSASHHIQQMVILEAKRQGLYSALSMKEIAYQLGFDDVAHFSKFFKNAAGESFSDFRKRAPSTPSHSP